MARILLMDDDLVYCFSAASDLRAAGHDVETTNHATDAKALLTEEAFDVAVVDIIVMSQGRTISDGGISLIGWMRSPNQTIQRVKEMPIIAISGSTRNPGMQGILETAKMIGATSSLEKPIPIEDLLDEITSLLRA